MSDDVTEWLFIASGCSLLFSILLNITLIAMILSKNQESACALDCRQLNLTTKDPSRRIAVIQPVIKLDS